jgi:hypothetical protein
MKKINWNTDFGMGAVFNRLIKRNNKGKYDILALEAERMDWSFKTFPEATCLSGLEKLKEEIKEVEKEYHRVPFGNEKELAVEYADCLKCLFDSAGRRGIPPEDIFEAFAIKLKINKTRNWVKNPDNTYSHLKFEFHTEEIRCPDCGYLQNAKVEHTVPWYSYVHQCTSCGYIIMESEWNKTK